MNRSDRMTLLLVLLGAVLLVVLWYLFLFKPASEDLAQVNEEIEAAQAEQDQLRVQLAQLQDIRADSAELESTLAAYETLVPSGPGLPSLLRQLQTAANDSGMELRAVSPSAPSPLEFGEDGPATADIQSISLTVELEGGYFQLVDFLRRVEDPVIVGRVLLVDALTVGLEEYPTLTVGITARAFTTGEAGGVPEAPTTAPTPSPGGTESPEPTDPVTTPTEEVPS